MHAGTIISFQLSDWLVPRYGQVLVVQWDEIAIKILGCADIVYLQDWIFSYTGNRLKTLAKIFLDGDEILPLKTIVHRSIRRRSKPSAWQRWKSWCRDGQYRYHALHRKGLLPWDNKGNNGFWQLRYKLRGLLCIDGYLVPVHSRWRETPYYLEQYNFLPQKYPDVWKSIMTNSRYTS